MTDTTINTSLEQETRNEALLNNSPFMGSKLASSVRSVQVFLRSLREGSVEFLQGWSHVGT